MLTKGEKKLFEIFANELSNHQSNAGCNDFIWPDGLEETKESLFEFIKDDLDDYPKEAFMSKYTYDFIVWDALVKRILRSD